MYVGVGSTIIAEGQAYYGSRCRNNALHFVLFDRGSHQNSYGVCQPERLLLHSNVARRNVQYKTIINSLTMKLAFLHSSADEICRVGYYTLQMLASIHFSNIRTSLVTANKPQCGGSGVYCSLNQQAQVTFKSYQQGSK